MSADDLKKYKQEHLDRALLETLAASLGRKYNITVAPRMPEWYMRAYEAEPYLVKLRVNNDVCNTFNLKSAVFLQDVEKLDTIMLTLSSKECSGDDYLRLAEMFLENRDAHTDNDTIFHLLNLSEQHGQERARAVAFCLKYKDCEDWEQVYNQYNALLAEGLEPADFRPMSDNLHLALECYPKVLQNDREAMWTYVKAAYASTPIMQEQLKRLAKMGDQKAMKWLSDSLYDPVKSLKRQRQDLEWHEMAVANGYEKARFRVGRIYLGRADNKPFNLEKAAYYLRQCAEGGNVEAMKLMVRIYNNKAYSEYSPAMADYWETKAANTKPEPEQDLPNYIPLRKY